MSKTTSEWVCWRSPQHATTTTGYGWPQCTECGAGPAYHDRWELLPDTFELTIFVPAPDGYLSRVVAPRSAIVGIKLGERVMTYFEGHTLALTSFDTPRDAWEDGLVHASGRLVTEYPTIAQAFVARADVVAIGTYQPKTRAIDVFIPELLEEWLS